MSIGMFSQRINLFEKTSPSSSVYVTFVSNPLPIESVEFSNRQVRLWEENWGPSLFSFRRFWWR